jgi:hypothetical protein
LIRQACFECGMIDFLSSDHLILLHDAEASILHHNGSFHHQDIVTVCDFGCTETTVCSFRVVGSTIIPFGPHGKIDIGSISLENIILEDIYIQYGTQLVEWSQKMPKLQSRILEKIKSSKQSYSPIHQKDCVIKVLGQDMILSSHSEIKQWFAEYERIVYPLEKYLERVSKQSLGHSNSLVFTGGIFQSKYISEYLSEYFENQKIRVIAKDANMSTMNGAAYLGLHQSMIRQRVYRYSYGTQFSKLFDPATDNPNVYRWGTTPNQYIASYLPFTVANTPIPPDQVFEQIVCPANDTQTEFPFGLYYAVDQSNRIENAKELITITVSIPPQYRHMGRRNRFRVLMNFKITEIKFSVIHVPSGEKHDSVVVL